MTGVQVLRRVLRALMVVGRVGRLHASPSNTTPASATLPFAHPLGQLGPALVPVRGMVTPLGPSAAASPARTVIGGGLVAAAVPRSRTTVADAARNSFGRAGPGGGLHPPSAATAAVSARAGKGLAASAVRAGASARLAAVAALRRLLCQSVLCGLPHRSAIHRPHNLVAVVHRARNHDPPVITVSEWARFRKAIRLPPSPAPRGDKVATLSALALTSKGYTVATLARTLNKVVNHVTSSSASVLSPPEVPMFALTLMLMRACSGRG